MADLAQETWEALWQEAKQHLPADKFMTGLTIAYHGMEWVSSRNPHHIDAAVILCARAGIAPLPSLMPLIQQVAEKRLTGEIRAGTAAQLRKAAAKDFALNLMTILCAVGASREVAASKAAQQVADRWGSPLFKASSLDKFYTRRWQDREEDRRAYFATEEGAALVGEWQRFLQVMPGADEELTGERR